jgi:hypothetical protein
MAAPGENSMAIDTRFRGNPEIILDRTREQENRADCIEDRSDRRKSRSGVVAAVRLRIGLRTFARSSTARVSRRSRG